MADASFGLALLGCAAASGVASSWLFRRWRRRSAARGVMLRITIAGVTTLAMLSALELAAARWLVHSDGFGITTAGRRWLERHWQPINSLGYRDHEPALGREHLLLVAGDSFAAGHGIEDVDDRFAGVLQRALGPSWAVAVVAENGFDPEQELAALERFPRQPDRIVVSYYVNDIESAARALGRARPEIVVAEPSGLTGRLLRRSHAFDWLYWRVVRGRFGDGYWGWIRAAHADPDVYRAHVDEFRRFVAFAREAKAELLYVVWPHLEGVAESRPLTDRVCESLRALGVTVVDLGAAFEGTPASELVVNPMDAHPSRAAHAAAAARILAAMPR